MRSGRRSGRGSAPADKSSGVSFSVRRDEVKKWLTIVLAPHFTIKARFSFPGQRDESARVLQLTVARILADKKLVNQIWNLRKSRS